MTFPPAKRQRKILRSDDDDDPVIKTRRPPPRLSSGPKFTLSDRISINRTESPKRPKTRSTTKASPKSSPEKVTRRTTDEKENKSLHTFFGKVSEEERWARKDKNPPTIVEDGDAGDSIEDDSLDEAFVELADGEEEENKVLDRRKAQETRSQTGFASTARNGLVSSQKFAKPMRPVSTMNKAISSQVQDVANRPWAERFAPTSLEELAVHKKKVSDVQSWLTAVLQGSDRRRLLVLKGPAGSGKTTTISLLSEAMEFTISEWRSPTVADTGMTSFSSQFDDFLNRGGSFGALDFANGTTGLPKRAGLDKRILLVEEFPSTMTLSSSALASFRHALLQYLVAAAPRSAVLDPANPHLQSHPPIVLIISESLLTSVSAAADNFTAHRLLGPDLTNHPYVMLIEFNPVAPTFMTKALELAIKKEARISKRRRIPGQAVLKRLCELGDVRSAVNGLEFLCVRGDAGSDWGGRTAAKAKNSRTSNLGLTSMERDSLELITQREATLGVFHAVGKVVWNRREDPRIMDSRAQPPPKPPDHLPAFDREKVSEVDTDELLNQIGTDIQTFTAALHENYVLSTAGSRFTDTASDCMEFLSESDLLGPGSRQMNGSSRSGRGSGGTTMHSGGIDTLRQSEISFQVAVRGLLFSLPSPVSRAAHPNGRKGDSYKMFYPASLKLWKSREEMYDLISRQVSCLSASDTAELGPGSTDGKAQGVESWKSRSCGSRTSTDQGLQNDGDARPRVWATRDEALLERLPYMMKLQSGNHRSRQEIRKITQLNGILVNNEDDEDDGVADVEVDMSAADEITDRTNSPRKGVGIRQDLAWGRTAREEAKEVAIEQKLYISEDDISDD